MPGVIENISIPRDSQGLREIVAGSLRGLNAIVPGLGSFLSLVAESLNIRGRTQHLGVSEGYQVAREVADRVGLQVREQFYPSRSDTFSIRVALTRRLARTAYLFFMRRYPRGIALDTVQRIYTFTTAATDEIYTVFYLSAYVMARNADIEHWQEELTNFLRDVMLKDAEDFVRELPVEQREIVTDKKESVASTGVPVAALAAALGGLFYFTRSR